MAEPARQLDDDPNKVYDEPTGTAASSPKPDLKALEGGGETTEPKRGHLTDVSEGSSSSESLSKAEEDSTAEPQHEQQIGSGYKQAPVTRGRQLNRWVRLSGRKKWGLGLGGGLIGGGIIAFILLLLPALRLEGYLATINNRVFAAASNAVSQRVEHLFEGYMAGYVLALDKCGGHISVECRANYSNSGIASSLFKSWQDARIEETLFDKYHFQVVSLKNSSTADGAARFVLKDPFGRQVTLTNGDLRKGNFTGGSRELGNEINKFLKDNTHWYDVMQRRSVRKYMVRKHDVKFWCFFACETKDSIDTKLLDAKTKFKYKLVERIIYPFSPKLGLIMDCLINPDGDKCSPEALRARGIDRSLLSDEDVAKITQSFADNKGLTLTQIMIQNLLAKIVSEETAQRSVSAIPVAGQIYLALSVIDMINTADKCLDNYCLSKYAADINSQQYLEYYAAMRSGNDEMKAGALSADEAGTLSSQFDDGGRPAEESLVYQSYTNPGAVTALLDNKAYAASAQPTQATQQKPYLCANGDPIPAGQLVCPEKKVTRTYAIEDIRNNKFVNGIDGILNIYQACPTVSVSGVCIGLRPVTIVHPVLQKINSISAIVLGPLVKAIIDGSSHLPGIGAVISYVTDKATALLDALLGKLFPLPVQLDSPGRDKYDGLEAGGEVAASEFNKGGYTVDGQSYGLGGKLLTPQEQSKASEVYLNQEDYNDSHSGFIARATNMGNPNSLASRFITAMPTTWSQASNGILAFMAKPFGSFGAIWNPAYAATNTGSINAFGIPRFGYTANDPVFNADPSVYTPAYCQQLEQTWQASKTDDPVSGIDEYSTTNPCLLEQVSVEAASSVFTGDDSLNN